MNTRYNFQKFLALLAKDPTSVSFHEGRAILRQIENCITVLHLGDKATRAYSQKDYLTIQEDLMAYTESPVDKPAQPAQSSSRSGPSVGSTLKKKILKKKQY